MTKLEMKTKVIEHWKQIRRDPIGSKVIPDGPWAENCAFCVSYGMNRLCMRCPIKIKTGLIGCLDTPYGAARDAWNAVMRFFQAGDGFVDPAVAINALVKWRQKSADELRFLRDLEV